MLATNTILQNRYRIVRPLGRGGMGIVYEAIDERFDSQVAIKQSFFTDEKLCKQFEREARLLNHLHHPAMPKVSDHFMEGGSQFLVMQFIGGKDLGELLSKRQNFSPEFILKWANQLLDALEYLHTQTPPVLHRDIKPPNLKLTANGQIILLDFGLAKGKAGQQTTVMTSQTLVGYSLAYSPLEQILKVDERAAVLLSYQHPEKVRNAIEKPVDARSDLYALGATLYHLVTGVMPLDALQRALPVWSGQPDPLRPAHVINKNVSPAVSKVLAEAMNLDSEHRPPSAAKMREQLSRTQRSPELGTTVATDGEKEYVIQTLKETHRDERRINVTPPSPGNSMWGWIIGIGLIAFGAIIMAIALTNDNPPKNPPGYSTPTPTIDLRGKNTGGTRTPTPAPTPTAPPVDITVSSKGNGQYSSISSAITSASSGARILVEPGTYYESIIIVKDVEIVGKGDGTKIIIECAVENCIEMQTNRAVIRNLTVRLRTFDENLEKVAVYIPRGQLILEDCSITSNSLSGIHITGSIANPIIRRCEIYDSNGAGIVFADNAKGIVEDSSIYGSFLNGIEIRNGAEATIRRSQINQNKGVGVFVHTNGLGRVIDSDLSGNEGGTLKFESGSQLYKDGKLLRRN